MTAKDLEQFTGLAKYEAEFCSMCKVIQPLIDGLSNDYEINLLNIDATKEAIAQEYEVYSVPSLFFYKDGVIKERICGAIDDETLRKKVELYGIATEKISRF